MRDGLRGRSYLEDLGCLGTTLLVVLGGGGGGAERSRYGWWFSEFGSCGEFE